MHVVLFPSFLLMFSLQKLQFLQFSVQSALDQLFLSFSKVTSSEHVLDQLVRMLRWHYLACNPVHGFHFTI